MAAGTSHTDSMQETTVEPPLAPSPAKPQGPPTLVNPVKEIRFAVVMYGGVSLAVYINGVSQELFHMVRATAPADLTAVSGPPLLPDDQLTGSERVYRRVAGLLTEHLIDIAPGDDPTPIGFRSVF